MAIPRIAVRVEGNLALGSAQGIGGTYFCVCSSESWRFLLLDAWSLHLVAGPFFSRLFCFSALQLWKLISFAHHVLRQ